MRFLLIYIPRLFMFGVTAAVCVWLTATLGAWPAIGLWAVGIGGLCGGVAWRMSYAPVGRVTFFNRFAFMVLPWGYVIGRGKLLPIVIESWLRWLLIGMAVVVLASHGVDVRPDRGAAGHSILSQADGYHRSVLVSVLLFLSWMIVGSLVARWAIMLVVRGNSNPLPPGVWLPILGMAGLIASSVGLTIFGHTAATTRYALLLTGGPILLIGGGYALFLLVMLAGGRKARWN